MRLKKKFTHFQKSPHINISKYFQEIFIHVGSYRSLLSNDTKTSVTILYAWVSRSHICEIDQNPGLTGIGICFVCYQQHWESWKGFELIILVVWWQFMKEHALLCVYSDICHRHFMLHRAINYIIERFGLTFWCFTALIITALHVITEHTKK